MPPEHVWERIGLWRFGAPAGPNAGHVCGICGREVGPMLYFVRVESCPGPSDDARKAVRAVQAVTSEAIPGTDIRTNGCRVCGEGSGGGYCGDHQPEPEEPRVA